MSPIPEVSARRSNSCSTGRRSLRNDDGPDKHSVVFVQGQEYRRRPPTETMPFCDEPRYANRRDHTNPVFSGFRRIPPRPDKVRQAAMLARVRTFPWQEPTIRFRGAVR